MRAVALKRVYDEPSPNDGLRVLVDRLWPRGLSKQNAAVDLWLKDVAPSNALRQWFQHDPAKWPAFQKKYRQELRTHHDALAALRQKLRGGKVTLLYGAKDPAHNQARVLQQMLQRG